MATSPKSTSSLPGTSQALRRVYHLRETIAFYWLHAELLTAADLDFLDARSAELRALLGVKDSDEEVLF